MTIAAAPALSPSKRIIGLDLLRALAVVAVLGAHMEALPTGVHAIVQTWHSQGGHGVDLFFVLSGFLVSGLLIAEYKTRGEISVRQFYVRRAWRIYPPFYAMIFVTYVVQKYVIGVKMDARQKWSELFFLQSYLPGHWNHTWTLAVEEHFYIALPLLLLGLVHLSRCAKDPFKSLPYLVAACCVAGLLMRIATFYVRSEVSIYTHVFPTHLRMDELFVGVAIAYGYHFHADWFHRTFHRWRHALIVVGFLLLTSLWMRVLNMPGYSDFYWMTYGHIHHFLGAAAMLIGVLLCDIPRNRLTDPLARLGMYSYSIYLWHMAVMRWMVPHLEQAGLGWGARQAAYVAGSLAVGVVMAKAIELPVLRFRDRMTAVLTKEQEAPAANRMAA